MKEEFVTLGDKCFMKRDTIILTNNPMVRDYFEELKFQVLFIDGSYKQVLDEIQKKVHLNYKLLTHPLSGSIKPNETPYKSVAIAKSDKLDMLSLELISNAIDVFNRLWKDVKTPDWSDRILGDFKLIDFDLIKNAIT